MNLDDEPMEGQIFYLLLFLLASRKGKNKKNCSDGAEKLLKEWHIFLYFLKRKTQFFQCIFAVICWNNWQVISSLI